MALSVTALSVGRAFGLNLPCLTYMRGWGSTIDIPLIMFVVEGGDAPIVVDTGADVTRAWDTHGIRMEQTVDEQPDVALRSLGIEPDEVQIVVNTHMHWDHNSNNHLFPNARVVVQQRELDFARNPVPWHRMLFDVVPGLRPAWQQAEEQMSPVDGDIELAPGVTLVTLPGHTPGSQGVLVEAAGGRYLIAGDCVYLYDNWHGDDDADHIPPGYYTDLIAHDQSLHKIESLACEVIPSHDSRVVERKIFK
ncbi:N-acyl homoserine lactonase family protein [Streptomyces phaeochromogenes]|uniref:N-acyl homoserine lactonase family protein n=1 Tax=Streptomyces phaeochromogenes TaxID=1923 RepID=UPI0033DAAB79